MSFSFIALTFIIIYLVLFQQMRKLCLLALTLRLIESSHRCCVTTWPCASWVTQCMPQSLQILHMCLDLSAGLCTGSSRMFVWMYFHYNNWLGHGARSGSFTQNWEHQYSIIKVEYELGVVQMSQLESTLCVCVCLVYSYLRVSEGCGNDLLICIRTHCSIHASVLQGISGLWWAFTKCSVSDWFQTTLWHHFTPIQSLLFFFKNVIFIELQFI